jgi:Spy/CpxP family protein refolding chaperone
MKRTALIRPLVVAFALLLPVGLTASSEPTDHANCPMKAARQEKDKQVSTSAAHDHSDRAAQERAAGAAFEDAEHEGHQAGKAVSPYTDRARLEIKALTPETIDQYRQGTGMGMAIPAELNGYPGPRHVLDLAEEVDLTPEQRTKIEALHRSMKAEAVRLGEEIIDRETRLDREFASGTISEATLETLTREIAVRQGKLRATHLEAHIATRALLTRAQITAYNKARGY